MIRGGYRPTQRVVSGLLPCLELGSPPTLPIEKLRWKSAELVIRVADARRLVPDLATLPGKQADAAARIGAKIRGATRAAERNVETSKTIIGEVRQNKKF